MTPPATRPLREMVFPARPPKTSAHESMGHPRDSSVPNVPRLSDCRSMSGQAHRSPRWPVGDGGQPTWPPGSPPYTSMRMLRRALEHMPSFDGLRRPNRDGALNLVGLEAERHGARRLRIGSPRRIAREPRLPRAASGRCRRYGGRSPAGRSALRRCASQVARQDRGRQRTARVAAATGRPRHSRRQKQGRADTPDRTSATQTDRPLRGRCRIHPCPSSAAIAGHGSSAANAASTGPRRSPGRSGFEHDTAVAPPIAPAIDDIAGADGGDVAWPAVDQCQTIQVAAIFRRQLAEERRPPQRREAARCASVPRQPKPVATKTTRPVPSTAISWTSRSPVV